MQVGKAVLRRWIAMSRP